MPLITTPTTLTASKYPSTGKRLAGLYLPYRRQVEAIMQAMEKLGLPLWLVNGYRSPAEQALKYSVLRGTPGQPFNVSGFTVTTPPLSDYPGITKPITDAPPYQSAHQWGLAVDFGWIVNGTQLQNPEKRSSYPILYSTAETYNAEDITKYLPGDKGHIQSKAWHWVKTNLLDYKNAYLNGEKNGGGQDGGKAAIFAKLDADVAAGRVKV